ncbi:MAG TPA: phosphoadenylyl-sulfate reductase [Bryobacteraceae bacterium]|nr:phosphoadenylyl-sulfate reductase [Bryobacteraceae bacterium]
MKSAEAADVISQVLSEHRGAACVTSSFQTDCMALVHMITRQRPGIPVLFLDTGYHFAETYQYRDRMAAEMNLNLVNLVPRQSVAEQEAQFGILYNSAPDRCCGMRKVEPLFTGLEPYDVWFTALRREQSPTRANLKTVDSFALPGGKVLTKVSPLADWTARDVWQYLREHGIPPLPLYDQGFTSIGCEPCTSLPVDPDNPRSGRWAGRKLECGIHLSGH